ncbi:D-alanyl-D-alanine carboxypeptidase family protein [Abyssisolibacter fermentans]|uniref:D-alanyl-D-alanine carboxypeptidase family protein n=1 Tax=Abyssisolibacter fermentans TaxID=1766203 RepID=UPI0008295414|nr:D-alanyl-D-alanine carboxypeptidase [Abyssisolibacter fermentans]
MRRNTRKKKMRMRRRRIGLFFLLIVCIISIYKLDYFENNKTSAVEDISSEKNNVKVEDAINSEKKINLLFEHLNSFDIFPNPDIDITAKSALLMNIDTKQILFHKAHEEKMFPASTTKVLTVITALDYLPLDKVVTVGDEANRIGFNSSRAGLDYSEKISIEKLLYALMLPSGNDAAQVLAVNAARAAYNDNSMDIDLAIEKFLELMNKKAEKLGAENSHFVTVDGYHDDNHYTTAKDLAMITLEAMKNEFLCNVVKTDKLVIKDWKQFNKRDAKFRDWINTNMLIQEDSKWYMKEATGFKTGHTDESGYCLIATAKEGDKNVLAVILGSTEDDVFSDAQKLLKYGLFN